jgi:hypothetical protein
VRDLQCLLDGASSSGCRVSGFVKQHENGVVVFSCRNEGQRACLVTPGEQHEHNNAYLRLKPLREGDSGEYDVGYGCPAKECYESKLVHLGTIKVESGGDESSSDEDGTSGGYSSAHMSERLLTRLGQLLRQHQSKRSHEQAFAHQS